MKHSGNKGNFSTRSKRPVYIAGNISSSSISKRTAPRAPQSLEIFFAGMFIPFDLPTRISEVPNAEMKISVPFAMVSGLLDKLYTSYTNPNQMRKTRKKQKHFLDFVGWKLSSLLHVRIITLQKK